MINSEYEILSFGEFGNIFKKIKNNKTVSIYNHNFFFNNVIDAHEIHNFINYLLEKKPKICFHIEPTVEFYTNDTIFDYLATKFHRKRGYTEGLVPYLKKLESNKKIKIDVCHRFNFGSMFMEGYNLVVWRCVD